MDNQIYILQFVGNKAKGRISKWMFQESKARQNFRKSNISLSGGKKCLFFRNFGVFCFLETSILRFALLPHYRRIAICISDYTKCMLYSEQPTVLLVRRQLNTMILTNFKDVNFISNIFKETNNFLVLMDPIIICIYLLNTFRNPALRIFAAGKASLVNKIPFI